MIKCKCKCCCPQVAKIIGYGNFKLSFAHLDVVWSQDNPATEAVAQIDDGHAAAEPNHIRERCSKCDDQDLWEVERH